MSAGGLTGAGGPNSTITHSPGWHISACWGFHLKALPPFHMVLLSFPWGCLGFLTAWWLGVAPVFQEQGMEAAHPSLKSWAQKLAQRHSIILLFKQSLSLPRCQGRCHRLHLSVGRVSTTMWSTLIYDSARHSMVIYGKASL